MKPDQIQAPVLNPFPAPRVGPGPARRRGQPRYAVAAYGILTVLAFLLVSCSDELLLAIQDDVERATAPRVPTIEILRGATPVTDGSSVDYGSQPTGSSTDLVYLVRNTGTGTLVLGTPTVTPSNAADGFSLESLSGTSVAEGASVNLTIRFAPAAGGVYSAAVTVPSNALNDDSVAFGVSGTGVAPDTIPPTGSVSVAGGAAYTQGLNVNLAISANDTGGGTVTEMEVRNDAAFSGNWQTYAASLFWSLSAGDGTKTVYVRFRDNSGNVSTTYSDSITLDTVSPSVISSTPAGGEAHQSRGTNITVNFSETMDQNTFTSTGVYLTIKGGSTVPTTMIKAASSVTLDPVSNLLYGYDYTIVVTDEVKDLSGRSITSELANHFTVERDYWEGTTGNDISAYARDLTDNNLYYDNGYLPWTDFVPDTQEESTSWSLPVGVHTPLAVLEGADYYTIEVPDGDAYYLRIRVLFTTDAAHGTTVDTSGSESLVLYVTHNGHGMGGYIDTITDLSYDRYYEYDISDPDIGGPGTYTILIYEASSNYSNRRTYNLRWYMEPGI